jgi:uncharacterized protein YbjT (DUF2867 family)
MIGTRWAGSPAASSPTGAKPNGPSHLAEQLGSVNAAAAELGTTWPSLRKAFTRRGLGMPARNPEASASAPSPPPTPGGPARAMRCRWTRCSSR